MWTHLASNAPEHIQSDNDWSRRTVVGHWLGRCRVKTPFIEPASPWTLT